MAIKNEEQELKLLEAGKQSLRYEVNFVISKFNALAGPEKKRFFTLVNSENPEDQIEAGFELVKFIYADPKGIAKFLSPDCEFYTIDPALSVERANYLRLYFKHNFKKEKGKYTIEPIS